MDNWVLLLFAVLFLVLIPFAAKLLRLRIRFFRWLHWEWGAKLLEDHFRAWSWFMRVVFLAIAVVLLSVVWSP